MRHEMQIALLQLAPQGFLHKKQVTWFSSMFLGFKDVEIEKGCVGWV